LTCRFTKTLLPIILPAQDPASFPQRLRSALHVVLTKIGVTRQDIDAELAEMEDVAISKTASRQILGSMNDFSMQPPWNVITTRRDRGSF
jgi:hypothetical protein